MLKGAIDIDEELQTYQDTILDLKAQLKEGRVKLQKEHDETRILIQKAIQVRHDIHAHHTADCN